MMSGQVWNSPPDVSYSYAWLRCDASGNNCVASPQSHGPGYPFGAADVGHTIRAQSIATTPDGVVTATSAQTAVVIPAAPRWATTPRLSADVGHVGDTITVTPATWTGPALSSDSTQVMRCTNVCRATTAPANATSYTIVAADMGSVLRVQETATNAGGSTTVWSSGYIGPVTSATSGSAVVGTVTGADAVRNAQGVTMATAKIVASLGGASTAAAGRVLKLSRAPGISGPLKVWVTPVAAGNGQAPVAVSVTMHGAQAKVPLPSKMIGKVLVVVTKKH